MYRKLAALVLAAALLCSCSAHVTVQRYPAELPRAESPAATPTPEPVPTFTEEQKSYGSAALLTDATVLVNVFLNDAAHGQTWDAESRTAAHPAGRGLDHRAGRGLRGRGESDL